MESFWDTNVGSMFTKLSISRNQVCDFAAECVLHALDVNKSYLQEELGQPTYDRLEKIVQTAKDEQSARSDGAAFVLSLRPDEDSEFALIPEVKYSIFAACYFLELLQGGDDRLGMDVADTVYASVTRRQVDAMLQATGRKAFDEEDVFKIEESMDVCNREISFQLVLLDASASE